MYVYLRVCPFLFRATRQPRTSSSVRPAAAAGSSPSSKEPARCTRARPAARTGDRQTDRQTTDNRSRSMHTAQCKGEAGDPNQFVCVGSPANPAHTCMQQEAQDADTHTYTLICTHVWSGADRMHRHTNATGCPGRMHTYTHMILSTRSNLGFVRLHGCDRA